MKYGYVWSHDFIKSRFIQELIKSAGFDPARVTAFTLHAEANSLVSIDISILADGEYIERLEASESEAEESPEAKISDAPKCSCGRDCEFDNPTKQWVCDHCHTVKLSDGA